MSSGSQSTVLHQCLEGTVSVLTLNFENDLIQIEHVRVLFEVFNFVLECSTTSRIPPRCGNSRFSPKMEIL